MRRPRLRTVLLVIVAILVVLGGSFVLRLRASANRRYDVVSIEQSPAYRDPVLLARAFALPNAAAYSREIYSQANPSTCGPASVANLARSLGQRQATEKTILEGTGLCWTGYCIPGITVDQLANLAQQRTGRRATVVRDLTLAELRVHLQKANDPRFRYLANFHRGMLFAKGPGHHSPIGGYLAAEDLVLVLDVNGKFGPWLVSSERLFKALDTVDPSTGRKRGLVQMEVGRP